MYGENVSKPYSPQNETKALFNNQKWSDVTFLVDGRTVHGHKLILGMGSPVFDRMFFGELKEQDVIEIKDLSFVGFMNALRYIYGFQIDFELFDLYVSYMAADKYLLHHFSEAFFDYIKSKLNPKNSCLIYDQLMKIQKEEISLAYVRNIIIDGSKETFESEYFTQIDQETLISLLSLSELRITEIDLVIAVSKWVDCEVQRQGRPVTSENIRKVFAPIKSYIIFSALKPEKIANCKEIAKLLSIEEIGSLVLHLLNKNQPWSVELKTPRRAGFEVCRVFAANPIGSFQGSYQNETFLMATQSVCIQTIYTTYSAAAMSPKLFVQDFAGLDLVLEIETSLKEGKWAFTFNQPLFVEATRNYKFLITAGGSLSYADGLVNQRHFNHNGLPIFYLSFRSATFQFSFIRGIDFLPFD